MLVRIREITLRRHDIAEREFLRQKNIVEQLRIELQKRKDIYEQYVASMPRLEDEVFARIFDKPVPDKDIDSYKIAIRKIRECAEELKAEMERVKAELEEEEKILEEKRKILQGFQKKIKKFDNLIEKQIEEEKFIEKIKEDNEIEESFRPPLSK